MVDVFISYPRAERAKVEPIRERLEALGIEVFFDVHDIDGGDEFPDVIDKKLRACKAVLSCWSPLYFERRWCMIECRIGLKKNILVPVAIEHFAEDAPPSDLQFVNFFNLADWRGEDQHEDWQLTLRSLSRHIGRELSGVAPAAPQRPTPTSSDIALLRRASELAGAEHLSLDAAMQVHRIDGQSAWSTKLEGRIRYHSAVACAAFVEKLLKQGFAEADISIHTPYRSQCALIRSVLYSQGLRSVAVSTARHSQDGQRRVVVIDPVEAGSSTLNGELGDRFFNDALSRALSHVVLFLSPEDMANCQVVKLVSLAIAIQDRSSPWTQMPLATLLAQISPRK